MFSGGEVGVCKLSAERCKRLVDATGSCGDKVVIRGNYTYEDIALLQDKFYNGQGDILLHMSGDVKGWLCWKNLGPKANRELTDRIEELCGTEDKCETFQEVVEQYAEATALGTAFKYVGGSALALAGTWLVFGPGMSLWKWMAEKFFGPYTALFLMSSVIVQEVWGEMAQDHVTGDGCDRLY